MGQGLYRSFPFNEPLITVHAPSHGRKERKPPRAGNGQPAPQILLLQSSAGQRKVDGRAENDEANQDRDQSKHGFKRFLLG